MRKNPEIWEGGAVASEFLLLVNVKLEIQW